MSNERRIVLPLGTSVELFRDPTSPEPEARAKLASVLFDKVIFEGGLLEVEITTAGRNQWWTPAEQVTAEKLERTRHIHEPGTPFQLAMGVQPAQGVAAPPEAMRVVMAGEMKVQYVAEWTSVLNELDTLQPDWVEVFQLPDYALPPEIANAKRALDRDARYRDTGRGEMDEDIREWANRTFNRDVVLATHGFNAVFGVTTLFEPLLGEAGTERTYEGDIALDVVVPDVFRCAVGSDRRVP